MLSHMIHDTEQAGAAPAPAVPRAVCLLCAVLPLLPLPGQEPRFLNINCAQRTVSKDSRCSPCLTRSRCVSGGHWITNMRRMMTRHEVEVLQGFPAGRIRLPAGVSEKVYAGMLGNAFTVPVVGRVCLALLRTVGIVDPTWPDVWARS